MMSLNVKEKRLVYAILLSLTFMTVEVIGGWLANSIAIYSDAAHLLTDIAGFGIALVAIAAAKAPGNEFLTFGLVRVEIFGALVSVLSLWVISVVLLWAAYDRGRKWFQGRPEPINGEMMFAVALFGVFVNLCLGYIFQEEHGHSLAHDHSHGHAHEHSHGHEHAISNPVHEHPADCEHGHDHGHTHDHKPSERSSLLSPPLKPKNKTSHNGAKYTILDDDEDGDDHDHDHDHENGHEKDHHSHDSHAHSHGAHDHSHEHGHNSYHNDASPKVCNGEHHGHGNEPSSDNSSGKVVDANLEAAQLHVLADLAQSIGVALAAFIIMLKPDWQIVDPLCTLLATVFGLLSTMPLINRGMMILLEGVPSHVNWKDVWRRLENIPGVDGVHDLHIWSLSSETTSLSVHMRAQNPRDALRRAHAICKEVGIAHATIQVHDANDEEYCHAESCKQPASLPPHANHQHLTSQQEEHKQKRRGRSQEQDNHNHNHSHDHDHSKHSPRPASTNVRKGIAAMNVSTEKSTADVDNV